MRLCRCCLVKQANRPRRLCWTCYYTPGVPERFPSTSKYASRKARGVEDVPDFAGPAPEGEPTDAEPGSEEKLRVLAKRAELGQSLFHPLDLAGALSGLALLAFTDRGNDEKG